MDMTSRTCDNNAMRIAESQGLPEVSIGVVTALPEEFAALRAVFGSAEAAKLKRAGATGQYSLASVDVFDGARHTVALAMLADMGNNSAAIRATQMFQHCPNLKHLIMCGIGGAVPNPQKAEDHVRLGDIVVSGRGGVIQYDYDLEGASWAEVRSPPRPPSAQLSAFVRRLEADALLGIRPWEQVIERTIQELGPDWARPGAGEDRMAPSLNGDLLAHPRDEARRVGHPRVFVGPIASANKLLKNPRRRDQLRDRYKVKAVEMEGSGIADAAWNHDIGYLVVRGTCDYCDAGKLDIWHKYAAVAAAAYCYVLVTMIPLKHPGDHFCAGLDGQDHGINVSSQDATTRTDGGNTTTDIAVESGTRDIELRINRRFKDYSNTEQNELMDAVKKLLGVANVRIVEKREGSVVLRLSLSAEDAERLYWAVKQGELSGFAVDDALLVDADVPSVQSVAELPPMPQIGKSEAHYAGLARQANADYNVYALEAAKVGQYITLALDPHLDWPAKLRYFQHALKRHCVPPPVGDEPVFVFYRDLAKLVRQYAGHEAIRLASAEDDLYATRIALGAERNAVEVDAELFFSQLLGTGDRRPEWVSDEDWYQLKIIRDQWI